jgi:hypothetical protein
MEPIIRKTDLGFTGFVSMLTSNELLSLAPQFEQNDDVSRFSAPHFEQNIVIPLQ